MTETKAFPSLDVLSAVTGYMVGKDFGAVCEVLNWMAGEPVWTHQLPRVGREAQPVVLALHPDLKIAVAEAEQVNPSNWEEWATKWLARYGETLTVPRLSAAEHESIDPLSELAEKVHPDRIVVVNTTQEPR